MCYIKTHFFKKKNRKWMWRSSNRTEMNKINFIMTLKKGIVNVSVINKLNAGTDHKLIRAKVLISTKEEIHT